MRSLVKQGVTKFYIAVDGVSNIAQEREQAILLQNLEVLLTKLEVPFEISILPRNFGIAANMVSALDWFFSVNDFGIIFEDDVIPESGLIDFFKSNLSELVSSKSTMIIGFYNPDFFVSTSNSSIKTQYPLIWGWGTTKDKWTQMRNWYEFNDTHYISSAILFPSIREYFFWRIGLNRVKKGLLDSWALVMAYHFISRKLFTILPASKTYASNRGIDEFAVHTKKGGSFSLPFVSGQQSSSNLDFEAFMRQNVYKIRFRHIFLPLYSGLVDGFRSVTTKKKLREKLAVALSRPELRYRHITKTDRN